MAAKLAGSYVSILKPTNLRNMNTKAQLQEQIDLHQLSNEATQILEILDQIENHTSELRKKLLTELKKTNSTIKLKLDEV